MAIGKKELALALGWSRPKLDRRLSVDPNFPVETRGDQAGGWAFNLSRVTAYLQGGTPAPKKAAPPKTNGKSSSAIDAKQLADQVKPPPARQPVVAPRRSADHRGESTARQRVDTARAEILEIKAGKERDRFVEAEDVRRTIETMLTHLGNALNGMPDAIVKLFGLQPDAEAILREMFDDLRINMKKDLERFLAE